MTTQISMPEMQARLVRYRDLRPCTTAFIDTRTPGSDLKENFTIIGPGVSENPEQHVHINLPHGFNIGGARQPPGCVNSQHSHETAEVFVIHSGRWRFKTGPEATDGHVDLGPGDTISIPVHTFRGFENVGTETGFMFAVLGGDAPGRVTWAPSVFEAAERSGLVLLESGRLIDTTREQVPPGAKLMPPTTPADVARFDRFDSSAIARCTVKADQLQPGGGMSRFPGFEECPIVGVANAAEQMPAAPLSWAHGFQMRALRVAPGARSPAHLRDEEEVLMVHTGQLGMQWADYSFTIGPGDTLTVPKHLRRVFVNEGREPVVVYVVRGGDHPGAAQLAP
jgi:mannose-6-phosphate isomerase-like protein (cupin superfamily)